MSDDLGRRRRLTPSGTRRPSSGGNGWLITIVAAVVVVVAGWFLGMALARFANGPKKTATVAQITPSPSPVATPTAVATAPTTPSPPPKPKARTTPRVATSAKPVAIATVKPTPSPTAAPTTVAVVRAPTPKPRPVITPARRHTEPVARRFPPTNPPRRVTTPPIATPAGAQGDAESAVRNYIDLLRRGDPQGAAVYLGNGSPDESFIDAHTRVVGMNTALQADGTYVIAVTMQTTQGRLTEIFNVASTSNGDRILEKSVQRP